MYIIRSRVNYSLIIQCKQDKHSPHDLHNSLPVKLLVKLTAIRMKNIAW